MNNIKPESTEKAEKIFKEACDIENRDAKLGIGLSKEENHLRKLLLTLSPVLGRIPSIAEIIEAFPRFSNDKVYSILDKLDRLDVIHLNKDKIVIDAIYPFSGSETSHLVTLKKEGYKKIYAMCAVDALGIGFMLDCDIAVDSRCFHCGEGIEIDIEGNKIIGLKPKSVVVWVDMDYTCCAATSVCTHTNFFCSEQHLSGWQKKVPGRKGDLLRIEEAFYLGKRFFENRI